MELEAIGAESGLAALEAFVRQGQEAMRAAEQERKQQEAERQERQALAEEFRVRLAAMSGSSGPADGAAKDDLGLLRSMQDSKPAPAQREHLGLGELVSMQESDVRELQSRVRDLMLP